ncbi:hypothetical protein OUZ56_027279 [Daphnia magna]|uniref:Circadian clock-controlled protein n=1 Tax=Daphnia magna TaxID=35525 RepID=A0ABQ9ZQ06_9CRUS|nr:hypothetical protein OUZ56_027279 [Daphnia magna]
MKNHLIIILLIVGISSSCFRLYGGAMTISGIHLAKSTLEDYVKQCWQDFIDLMDNGVPGLNIPTFDPWFANNSFPFRMQDGEIVLRADVNATNVTSLGFSSVQVPAVYETSESHYNVSLSLPDLKISGLYTIIGSHHYFYPIVGNGPFDMTLLDVSSSGTTAVLFDGMVYSLTKLQLTPLKYGSATSEFYGLSISDMDSTSETYIEIVHMMTELLWSHVEKELRLQLSDSITQYLNDQLLDFQPSSMHRQP